MTAIQTAVENLARAARVAIELGGMAPEAAVDLVCTNALKEAANAASRGGIWARESTQEQIEAALFQGSIARDALEGNFRPSVQNVRLAVLAAVAAQ